MQKEEDLKEQWRKRMTIDSSLLPELSTWSRVPCLGTDVQKHVMFPVRIVRERGPCLHNNVLSVPTDIHNGDNSACFVPVKDVLDMEQLLANHVTETETTHSLEGASQQQSPAFDVVKLDTRYEYVHTHRLLYPSRNYCSLNNEDLGVYVCKQLTKYDSRERQQDVRVSSYLECAACIHENIVHQRAEHAKVGADYQAYVDVLTSTLRFVEDDASSARTVNSNQVVCEAHCSVAAPTFAHILEMSADRLCKWHAHYASSGPVKFAMDIDLEIRIPGDDVHKKQMIATHAKKCLYFETVEYAEGALQEFEWALVHCIVDTCAEFGADILQEDVVMVSGCRPLNDAATKLVCTSSGGQGNDVGSDEEEYDDDDIIGRIVSALPKTKNQEPTKLSIEDELSQIPCFKYSMHVHVCPPWNTISPMRPLFLLRDGTQGEEMAMRVKERLVPFLQDFGTYFSPEHCNLWLPFFDMGIYARNHTLREIGSVKTEHPLQPMRLHQRHQESRLPIVEQMRNPTFWVCTRPRDIVHLCKPYTTKETGKEWVTGYARLTSMFFDQEYAKYVKGILALLSHSSTPFVPSSTNYFSWTRSCAERQRRRKYTDVAVQENRNSIRTDDAIYDRDTAIAKAIQGVSSYNNDVTPNVEDLGDEGAQISFGSRARGCMIAGREHARNTVWAIVSKKRNGSFCAYQKCHDPDCKSASYRLF